MLIVMQVIQSCSLNLESHLFFLKLVPHKHALNRIVVSIAYSK